MSERVKAYLRELVYRMLEIDWWKRPNCGDILTLLNSLSDKSLSDWVFSTDDSKTLPESEETSPEPTEGSSSAEGPNCPPTHSHGLKLLSEATETLFTSSSQSDNVIIGEDHNSP